MGWLDSVEGFASDAVGAVGSAASAVGGFVGDAASAAGGAVSDAGHWAGDHVGTIADVALAGAGFIPGVNIVTEGAQALWHAGKGTYDLATGKDGAALEFGEAAIHGGAAALNAFTGEGGEVLEAGELLAKEGVEHVAEAGLEQGAEHVAEGAGERLAEEAPSAAVQHEMQIQDQMAIGQRWWNIGAGGDFVGMKGAMQESMGITRTALSEHEDLELVEKAADATLILHHGVEETETAEKARQKPSASPGGSE